MTFTRVSRSCVLVLFLYFSLSVYCKVLIEGNQAPELHRTGTSEVPDFAFVTRDGWKATPATDQHPLNLPVAYVVVHHTAIPKACYLLEECKNDMRSMQNYHTSLGWGDIGYNFCIGAEGTAFEGRGWDNKGIHAGPANSYSIGICIIGDWREKPPPKESLDSLKALIETGIAKGKIKEDYKLIGHMQAMATECPGTALMKEISTWKHFNPGKFPQSTIANPS